MKWEHPGNNHNFIIDKYLLHIKDDGMYIGGAKTETIFSVSDESVTTIAFMAVNTCGTVGANVTLALPELHSVNSTSSPRAATQTVNYHENSTLCITLPLGLFFLLLLAIVIIIILSVILVYQRKCSVLPKGYTKPE